jgi:hypothetical protein
VRVAGLVGPTLLAISSTEAVNMGIFIAQSAPVVYLNGTVLFVAGLAIVRSHSHWRPDWTVLVTISGWGALLLGLWRMALPSSAQASQSIATYILLATLFIVGAVLSIAAYLPRPVPDTEGSE